MTLYPIAVAAETLGISRAWLMRLCRDRRVPGAVLTCDTKERLPARPRWMVPVEFRIEHVKFKKVRKGHSNGH